MIQCMKEQLYNTLPNAKYSLMKFGGDFPYLSNYQEYSMLILVHLRRHLLPHTHNIITPQILINNNQNNTIKVNITKLFESKSRMNDETKKNIIYHRKLVYLIIDDNIIILKNKDYLMIILMNCKCII